MIVRVGKKWVLFSSRGYVLGEHKTRRAARAQETAINLSKARAAGYRVPRRKART